MIINKKYQDKYNKFIEDRRERNLNTYTETHHIIPKCLSGSNEKINLIELTPREHFISHLLLIKVYPENKKLLRAMTGMAYDKTRRKLNSRSYDIVKKCLIDSNTITKPLKETLETLYFKNKKSFKKISKIYNVSDMTVCKWFKIYNIKVKSGNDYKRDMVSKNKLSKHLQTKTPTEIADFYMISSSTIYKWLKYYQISPKQIVGITKEKPTREILQDLYINKQYTLKKISKMYSVGKLLVSKWLKSYGIPIRYVVCVVKEKPTREILQDLYINKQYTLKKISKMYSVHEQTTSKWLKSYGICTRIKSFK